MKFKTLFLPTILFISFWLSSTVFSSLTPQPAKESTDLPQSKQSELISEQTEAIKPDFTGGLKTLLTANTSADAVLAPGAESYTDSSITITLLSGDELKEISLHDYLIGVVAAEMPASFGFEALKAQAVACRSCTLYNRCFSRPHAHPNADVCSDSKCCQAYKSDEALKEKWGNRFNEYFDLIKAAVEETDGLCLYYNEKLIYAPYHSSSDGATEDCREVWSETPYLVSVASPESDENVPNFISTVTVSEKDFEAAIKARYPDLAGNALSIERIDYTPSGRVQSITVGGNQIPGTTLRSMFSLRSTKMTIEFDADELKFTTYGWGHGIGMSQYGADLLADEGYSFEEILKWYYTDVEIGKYQSEQ